jgi:hypothetical protein
VVADRTKREHGALTFFTPRFVLLIQGVGLLLGRVPAPCG